MHRNSATRLAWGIIGTGLIAHAFAQSMPPSRTGKLVAVASATDAPLYSIEIDTVAKYLAAGEAPCMPINDSVGNMLALDNWRKKSGSSTTWKRKKLRTPACLSCKNFPPPRLNAYGSECRRNHA